MLQQVFRRAAIAVAFISIGACGDDAIAPVPTQTATLTITPPAATVYESDALVLKAVYRDAAGTVVPNAPIAWSLQDTLRAEVDANGNVLAFKNGVVKVTARSGDLTATFYLVIVRPEVLGVSVLLSTPTLSRGDVVTFGVRANGPGDRVILGRTVTLASDNPNVAMVDPAGRLRGVGAGTTTIRATVEGVVGTARVTVTANDAALNLTHFNAVRLPALIASDSVSWNGVRELHEVYAESGSFTLSGTPLRYKVKLNFYEYNVVLVNGMRQLQPRAPWGEIDGGLVQYDARGDLQLTSEFTAPLSHIAIPGVGGMQMNFHVPGDGEVWQLFFRREPE